MSVLSSPTPKDIANHQDNQRRISHWLAQTSRHRQTNAFAPATSPPSRASSTSSASITPSLSPSSRETGYDHQRTQAWPQRYPQTRGPVPAPIPVPAPVNMTSHHYTSHPHTGYASHYQDHSTGYPLSSGVHGSMAHSRSIPQPLAIPEDYVPVSQSSGHAYSRGRSGSRSHHLSSAEESRSYNPTSAHEDRSRSMHAPTIRGYGHTAYGSHHYPSSHHRSSSQEPSSADWSRPTYSRRRSRSYEPPSTYARSRGYGYGASSSQTSGGQDYHMLHASPTSPTLVHSTQRQPVVVSLNDGRDGYVVVPAKGQKLQVLDSSGKEHSPKSAKEKGEGNSFFGKLGFGKNKKRSESSHKRVEAVPVVSMVNPPRHRGRRDSY